jgi:probable HAF family extracellular repeat protein
MNLTKCSVAVTTLLGALALAPTPATARHLPSAAPPHYRLTVLGTLGGTFSAANGLNNRGVVAGVSTLPGGKHDRAFQWEHGSMTGLGTLGGPDSFVQESHAINNRGTIAGFSETARPDPNGSDFCGVASFTNLGNGLTCLPFVWRQGVITSLPTLGGNNGFASGINNRGQVVGTAETSHPDAACAPALNRRFEAVIWQHRQARELPPFPGDADGVANGVNNTGQAVGASGSCAMAFGNAAHALLWQHGHAINLGNLGGTTGNYAFGINNRGQAVGTSALPGNAIHHAFLWQHGTMTDLGALPGDVFSLANAINNRGQAVGFSQDAAGNSTALLWQHGVIANLNTLIPPGSHFLLLEALGINDRGQIVGYGIYHGQERGYLLTPAAATAQGLAVR